MKLARYFISGAGIIIGVAVAIVVLGVAQGGRSVLNDNFWNEGVKVYEIEISDKVSNIGEYLHWDDGKLLEDEMQELKYSIPILGMESQLKSYKSSDTGHILAVNAKYQQYSNLEILKGRFINDDDVHSVNKVAVLDDYTALNLFGTTDILGQKLEIQVGGKNYEFIICGIIKNGPPGICFIPDSVPVDLALDYRVEKIVVVINEDIHNEEAIIKIEHLLERKHGIEEVYNIKEYNQLYIVKEFIDDYMIFAVIISAISLLLGAIGLMNAILLTTQERRKEIGLYKLFGSGIRELQYEIIFKTIIVSLGCGFLGLVVGLLFGNVIGSFINIKVRVSLMSIFISVAVPAITGILSSLNPTLKINKVEVAEIIWEE